jgi:hypothetical protein
MSPTLTDRPTFDMTADSCPELRLMLNATKATVQRGKGLAPACPMDMKMDMKTVRRPHS